jgi:hypothetical protein
MDFSSALFIIITAGIRTGQGLDGFSVLFCGMRDGRKSSFLFLLL